NQKNRSEHGNHLATGRIAGTAPLTARSRKISGQSITGTVRLFLPYFQRFLGRRHVGSPVGPNKYSDLFGWDKRPIGMTHKAGVTGKGCPPTRCFAAARKQERGVKSR